MNRSVIITFILLSFDSFSQENRFNTTGNAGIGTAAEVPQPRLEIRGVSGWQNPARIYLRNDFNQAGASEASIVTKAKNNLGNGSFQTIFNGASGGMSD